MPHRANKLTFDGRAASLGTYQNIVTGIIQESVAPAKNQRRNRYYEKDWDSILLDIG